MEAMDVLGASILPWVLVAVLAIVVVGYIAWRLLAPYMAPLAQPGAPGIAVGAGPAVQGGAAGAGAPAVPNTFELLVQLIVEGVNWVRDGVDWANYQGRIAVGIATVFFVIYFVSETIGSEAGLWFLTAYLLVLLVGTLFRWPFFIAVFSVFARARPIPQAVAWVFLVGILLILLGFAVPFHEVPEVKLRLLAILASIGIGIAGYLVLLEGGAPLLLTPRRALVVLTAIVAVVALIGFVHEYDWPVGEWKDKVTSIDLDIGDRAEASEVAPERFADIPICDRPALFEPTTILLTVPASGLSEEHEVPPRHTFNIMPEGPVKVVFSDGSQYTVTPDECEDTGHRPKVKFRISSLDNTAQVVVIEQAKGILR